MADQVSGDGEGRNGGEGCREADDNTGGDVRRLGNSTSIIGRRFAKRFGELVDVSQRRSFYISQVFRSRSTKEDQEVIDQIASRGKNSIFKFVIRHGDHYHVLHDCAFSAGVCRCFGKLPLVRCNHKAQSVRSISPKAINQIIDYHFEDGRTIYYGKIGCTTECRFLVESGLVRSDEDSAGLSGGSSMEVCASKAQLLWDEEPTRTTLSDGEPFDSDVSGQHSEAANEQEQRTRGKRSATKKEEQGLTKRARLIDTVESMHMSIVRAPLANTADTLSWSKKCKHILQESAEYRHGYNLAKLQFFWMKLRDYKKFYQNEYLTPHWGVNNMDNFYDFYETRENSRKMVKRLLIFQFSPDSVSDTYAVIDNNWKQPVYTYIRSLIALLDKKRKKLNTDLYTGGTSSGKSLFFKMVADYLVSTGEMSTWNRNVGFPLQMCGNVKLIIWNEANYSSDVERNVLKLLGGDCLNAQVKFKDDKMLEGIPVVVCSNQTPFPSLPEFRSRIVHYSWNTAPFLDNLEGRKLHPMAFEDLMNEAENYFEEDLRCYVESDGRCLHRYI